MPSKKQTKKKAETAKKRAEAAVSTVQRVLKEEYVRAELHNAAGGLRAVYGRVRTQPGRAAADRLLYGHLRQAATSVRNAALALQPSQPPPQHRGRKLTAAALIGGGSLLMLKRSSTNGHRSKTGDEPSGRTPEPQSGASPTPS
jgi:hypothetical protein